MITVTDKKAINSLNWMLSKAVDVYGDDTGYQFKGNMPSYAVQSLISYFKANEISSSVDTRTIKFGDWNVTLSSGKFVSQQNYLTVCFNRTNEWYARRELEAKGFLPKEASALVKDFSSKGKNAFDAFCTMIENGLINPDNYSF